MTDASAVAVDYFDVARQEIDGWRGSCMDIFSRCEDKVVRALLAARESGQKVTLEHLAGQRIKELQGLASAAERTARQKKAFQDAYEGWRDYELRRAFFAHGVVTELLDKKDDWHVRFDLMVCDKSDAKPVHWILSKTEAHQFVKELKQKFANLSNQIGQIERHFSA